MYDHISEFNDAVERTRRLKLEPPEAELAIYTHLTPETREQIHQLIREVLGEGTTVEYVCQNNFQIHLDLLEPLEELLGCKAYFTIGSIETPKTTLYAMDEETVAGWIGRRERSLTVNAHTWITLDSLEIIDATLLTTIGVMSNTKHLINQVVAANPEELAALVNTDPQGASQLPAGVKYHPFVVGTDLFRQMGILIDTPSEAASLYALMLASTDCPAFVVGITRSEIESGLWSPHKRVLMELVRDQKTARRWRNRLEITITGYTDDQRELFEIEEARRFMLALDEAWPYAFYFLNKEQGTYLRALFYAHCARGRITGPHVPEGKIHFDIDLNSWERFNQKHLDALTELQERLELPEQEIHETFNETAAYFGLRSNRRPATERALTSAIRLVGQMLNRIAEMTNKARGRTTTSKDSR